MRARFSLRLLLLALPTFVAWIALPLPAGQHTIELVYNPATFRVGAIISGLTWLSLAGDALWFGLAALRRRRK